MSNSGSDEEPPLNRVISYLQSLGYNHVSTNVRVRAGSRMLEADLVVYANSSAETPLVLVEQKYALPEAPSLLDAAVQQAYTLATLLGKSVRYLLITDGERHAWFERDPASQSLEPLAVAPVSDQRARPEHAAALGLIEVVSADQLTGLIQELVDVLRRESMGLGLPMAIEVNRILIAKLHDELTSTGKVRVARFRMTGRVDETADHLRTLYREAIAPWMRAQIVGEFWTASAETLARAVAILAPYALGSVRHDVLANWFWSVLPPLLPRSQSQYLTPPAIARAMVELTSPAGGDRIVDPACGAGLLLLEADRFVRRRNVGSIMPAGLPQEPVGVEVNRELAELAATNFILAGLNPDSIHHADALASLALERAGVRAGVYDLALLDPPLGRATPGDATRRDSDLVYPAGTGVEALFLEQTLNLLRAGGRLAVLVPDTLLSSPSHLPTRAWLLSHGSIRAVVSLPPEAFGPVGHSGKASILLVEKNAGERSSAEAPVFVADVASVGYDRFGNPLSTNDLAAVLAVYARFRSTGTLPPLLSRADVRVWTVPLSVFRAKRFDVLSLDPRRHDLAVRLRHGSYPATRLKGVAEIVSGRTFKGYVEGSSEAPWVVQAGAVREFRLDMAAVPSISPEEFAKFPRAQLRSGDVLVTTTGQYLGRAAVVGEADLPAVASGAVTILRTSGGIAPEFLAAFLNSSLGREQIASRQAAATAQPYIRRGDLGEILIPLPPAEIQHELGRRAHDLHAEAAELRNRAEAFEREARELVATALLGSQADE